MEVSSQKYEWISCIIMSILPFKISMNWNFRGCKCVSVNNIPYMNYFDKFSPENVAAVDINYFVSDYSNFEALNYNTRWLHLR